MPMGVASMSFTCLMPSAVTRFMCSGIRLSFISALRAGIRLSSISVVFPDPDTPVTAVSLPFGISTVRALTVCMGEMERLIRPSSNILPAGTCLPTFIFGPPVRNFPIFERGSFIISSTVPFAMTRPPSAPAPGPSSMI